MTNSEDVFREQLSVYCTHRQFIPPWNIIIDEAVRLHTMLRDENARLAKERSLHEEVLEDKLRDAMARLTEALDRCERVEKALAAAQIAISAIKTCGFDDWGTADALKRFEDLSGAVLSPGQPEGEKA